MKNFNETARAFVHWLIFWLFFALTYQGLHSGQAAVWSYLDKLVGWVITWAGVTSWLAALAVVAAILGSPFKPWRWLK